MIDRAFITGSVVMAGEVAAWRVDHMVLPEWPAVSGLGCEAEHALAGTRAHHCSEVAAALFGRHLGLDGVLGRFDPVSDPAEPPGVGLLGLAFPAQRPCAEPNGERSEVGVGDPLASISRFLACEHRAVAVVGSDRGCEIAFTAPGLGEANCDRCLTASAERTEPQVPEPPRVGDEIAMSRPPRQVRACDRSAVGAACDRDGVRPRAQVAERRADPGVKLCEQVDPRGQARQTVPVARLAQQIGLPESQPLVEERDRPPFGVAIKEELAYSERGEFPVAAPWRSTQTTSRRHEIGHQHETRGETVFAICVHKTTPTVDVGVATPISADPLTGHSPTPAPRARNQSAGGKRGTCRGASAAYNPRLREQGRADELLRAGARSTLLGVRS